MQLNILQSYSNAFIFFSHFLKYQHFYMNQIVHFELIEINIQTLHITFISIYENTHNNLILHFYKKIIAFFELLTFAHELNHSL
jgi:hypothetical protein